MKWNGKKKAITFSFDDGVFQDVRAIEILNRYGLKGTFNLNSGKWGAQAPYEANGKIVERTLLSPSEVKTRYAGHEVAVHTVAHLCLPTLNDECVTWQVAQDQRTLEALCGYPIRCMAYPCGGINNDDRVAAVIRDTTSIRFARTVISTFSFDSQENLLRFNPTLHFRSERLFELAEKFLASDADTPQLFYIWGHTYELDAEDGAWERFEQFCRMISGKEDIFYGTNGEIFFGGEEA